MVSDLAARGQTWSGRCYSWNLSWRRERFEWERQIEEQLLIMISKI